jgi:hypothetical protein
VRTRPATSPWVAIVGATTLLAAAAAAAAPAGAHPGSRAAAAAAAPTASEPPLTPTPRAICGPASRPETGIQGRVSAEDHQSGRAAEGYTCNTELVGSYAHPTAQGTVGGLKVERYVDRAGRECAYYDTTLLFPSNVIDGDAGVNVLDMSDPAQPKLTARLVTPAMLSPHESLVLNQRRGLLVAVLGNPQFHPGFVDVYDLTEDCRHPVLRASAPVGVFGHESGMAPDGRTFYSASPFTGTLAAIDLEDPSRPRPLWVGNYDSHGLSISDDGDRAYVAGLGTGLIILDTSEIQARTPNPTVQEVARLRWGSMSTPQNAIPVTIKGRPYLVEVDEYGGGSAVGAARIIDIGDERAPRVVSNLRLEVHQPEHFAAQAADPGADNPFQGYAAHYCNVPRRTDPGIVACSMILSGLRVFDIRDPHRPREIAYYNAPLTRRTIMKPSAWALSSPSFAPERGQIWYSDGFSGFHAVRLTNGVWPFPADRAAAARRCVPRRASVGRGGIGAIRLGFTREEVLALALDPPSTRRGALRFCVDGSDAELRAVLDPAGRVVLAATTAAGHRLRGVAPGAPSRRVRRRFPRARSLGHGVILAAPRSGHVLGVRGGTVRFIAVAERTLAGDRGGLRRALRRSDLLGQ